MRAATIITTSSRRSSKTLARWLIAQAGGDVKVFVDTAAVMEKPLAAGCAPRLAGQAHKPGVARIRLVAISRRDLHHARACRSIPREEDHCGSCRALSRHLSRRRHFLSPYRLDARRCISYLTIGHKSAIPREFREAIGNRIYGCDDCLAVCPWNKFAEAGHEAKLAARDNLRAPALSDLAALDDAAVSRAVLEIAGQAHRSRPLHPQCHDRNRQFGRCFACALRAGTRSTTPHRSCAGAAAWALARLLPAEEFEELAGERMAVENDEGVREEWSAYSSILTVIPGRHEVSDPDP